MLSTRGCSPRRVCLVGSANEQGPGRGVERRAQRRKLNVGCPGRKTGGSFHRPRGSDGGSHNCWRIWIVVTGTTRRDRRSPMYRDVGHQGDVRHAARSRKRRSGCRLGGRSGAKPRSRRSEPAKPDPAGGDARRVMRLRYAVAVAGANGKTTTTSMTRWCWSALAIQRRCRRAART